MDSLAPGFVSILYAEDFDDEVPPPPPEPPTEPEPAPPSYTQGELEAAQQAACADAVQAARAEWERSALHGRTQSLAAIAAALAGAQGEADALAEAVAEDTARTVLSVLAGLLPDLCARHGAAEVRALLRHLLPTLAQQPRIAVRVAPAALDGVREDLALLDEEILAAITLTAAPLAPGDARVTWTDGSLTRDQAATRRTISAALSELGLLDPVATQTSQRSLAHAE